MKIVIYSLLILTSFCGIAFAQPADVKELGKSYIQMNVALAAKPSYYINYNTLTLKGSSTKHNHYSKKSNHDFITKGSCIWSLWPLDHLLNIKFDIYQNSQNKQSQKFCSVNVGARADSIWGKLTQPVKFQIFSGDTCHNNPQVIYNHSESSNTAVSNISITPRTNNKK